MFYPIAAAYLLLTGTLLVFGTVYQKPGALYALKCVWLPGLVVATYLTADAWGGRSYGENWAVIGVVFFVLPFAGLVTLEAGLEFLLLKGNRAPHAKANRIVSLAFVVSLLALSIIGILSA